MRIGIVTIHHVPNYGAVFQAYALSQYLKRQGAIVEVIDYRPTLAEQRYRQRLWRGRRPNIRPYLSYRIFQQFITRHLPLSHARYNSVDELIADPPQYDLLIAGSDQIWCTGEGSFRGYDPAFFLDFTRDPSVAKVSYAASAGNTEGFAEHTPAIRNALDSFSAISVRDEHTAELVRRTAERSATVVLDPVFLHDFSELHLDTSSGDNLVVFSSRPDRLAQTAAALAKKHNLRIVSLMHRMCGADVFRRVVSPISWLNYIRTARLVLTDYFHGMAISLRFGTPVLADAPPSKTRKITGLLARLGLSELFIGDGSGLPSHIDRIVRRPAEFQLAVKASLSPLEVQSQDFLVRCTSALGSP